MIEIALAAFVPLLMLLIASRFAGHELQRASFQWFVPVALLWFAPCWMFGRSPVAFDYLKQDIWPWKTPGYHSSNALLSDPVLQIIPWREAVRKSVFKRSMPFLNRDAASGEALRENPQSLAAHPLTWIGLPFSSFAWPLFSAMTKLLAALSGTYLFLRARGVSYLGAVCGAIAYGLCAFNVVFAAFPHTNVTVMLPFLMFTIESLSAPGLAVSTALMLMGGHPESVLHCAMLAVPFAVARWGRRREILWIAAGGVVGLLLPAVAVVPFALYLPSSERVARLPHHPEILLSPSWTWSNAAVPFSISHLDATTDPNVLMNFNEVASQYAGLLTVGLAILTIVLAPRRNRFWIVALGAFTFLAFESPWMRSIVTRLPLMNVTVHGRVRFVMAFLVAVLAAHGIDLMDGKLARRLVPVVFPLCAVVALAFSLKNWLPAFGVLAATLTVYRPGWRRWLPAVLVFDLAALITYNPPEDRTEFYPRTGVPFVTGRVLSLGGALQPNSESMLGLASIGFHNPMTYEPYARFLTAGGYDRVGYFNVFHQVPPKALVDLLNVKWIAAPPDFDAGPLAVIAKSSRLTLMSNPNPLGIVQSSDPSVRARVTSTAPNWDQLLVEAGRPSRVLVAEAALPGWSLTMDGKEWPIDAFSGALISFTAPVGTHRFELRYRPVGFDVGLTLSCCGLVALILLVLPERMRRKLALARNNVSLATRWPDLL